MAYREVTMIEVKEVQYVLSMVLVIAATALRWALVPRLAAALLGVLVRRRAPGRHRRTSKC